MEGVVKYSMDKILITGTSGYLGARICDYLNTLRYEVIRVSFQSKKKNFLQKMEFII